MERKHEKYQQLIARCQTLTPAITERGVRRYGFHGLS
jgi:acetate kinase